MIVVGNRIVDPNLCDHEADPPVCQCHHDWRVEWGNVPKQPRTQPNLQTGS